MVSTFDSWSEVPAKVARMGRCDDRGAFPTERVFPRRVPAARAKQSAVVRGAVRDSAGKATGLRAVSLSAPGREVVVVCFVAGYCILRVCCTAVRRQRCLLLQRIKLRGGASCPGAIPDTNLVPKKCPSSVRRRVKTCF